MENIKWKVIREKCALLVIDMQNDFVLEGAIMEVPDAKKHIDQIKKLIKKCRELGVEVIYTVHETEPNLCPQEIAAFPHLINAGMRKGTKGVEVVDDLAPKIGEHVIRKHRFSAFFQTELELILRNLKKENPIDTLIICGTVSNICCESTARDAFFRDYKVVFGSDICSALTPAAHEATLNNMEIFGINMDAESIIRVLENGDK